MQAVVETLSEHGIESFEVQEDGYVSVEVPCEDGGDPDCHQLMVDIEAWLNERNLPFVSEEVDGRILIRPPAT